jgi:hypothetical protein
MDATKKWADKLRAKGKIVDFKQLLGLEPDSGTPNIRYVSASIGRGGSAIQSRCRRRGRKAVSALGARIDRKSLRTQATDLGTTSAEQHARSCSLSSNPADRC